MVPSHGDAFGSPEGLALQVLAEAEMLLGPKMSRTRRWKLENRLETINHTVFIAVLVENHRPSADFQCFVGAKGGM